MRLAWAASLVVVAAVAVTAPLAARMQGTESRCIVMAGPSGQAERLIGTAADCSTRLSPASTYKIPHALIGLETGAITLATVEKWDGRKYPNQPKWNQDHTVESSMRPSVLWFFQRMAPRIGATRAREWLTRWHYGNADTSGPIAEYWVNGRLRISPAEQVAFLTRFYGSGDLGISRAHIEAIQQALEQAPGTVENARGVHRLEVPWRDGVRLNSKTGAATIASGESVSWLVGRLTVDGRPTVFASAVWRAKGGVDTLAATTLAIKTFHDRGLLSAR